MINPGMYLHNFGIHRFMCSTEFVVGGIITMDCPFELMGTSINLTDLSKPLPVPEQAAKPVSFTMHQLLVHPFVGLSLNS